LTIPNALWAVRKLEELNKVCEEKTEEFKQLEQQDTRIREDMRHANTLSKKLEKTLQQEQRKVFQYG
jgi:predicted  nucleic acid-binding Zn-ribbon protein